jgi:hypothetical protein
VEQTKLESLLEKTMDMASGFIVAALAWKFLLAPAIIHGYIDVNSPLIITAIFTLISFWRGYFWRRFFENRLHKRIHLWIRYCR